MIPWRTNAARQSDQVAVDSTRIIRLVRAAAHDVEMVKRIRPRQRRRLKRVAIRSRDRCPRVDFLPLSKRGLAKRYASCRAGAHVGPTGCNRPRNREVARYNFKLLAYKKYEVARLHSDLAFRAKIAAQFDGDYKLNFYMAPPIISKPDPVTGKVAKKRFGPWMMSAFSVLARLKFLRGSTFDVFGYTAERKTERALIGEYEATVEEILSRLSSTITTSRPSSPVFRTTFEATATSRKAT